MKKIDKEIFIDFLGFACIGITSLLYIFFRDIFAEIRINLPFINFPIFIGEMVLVLCLILSLVKNKVYLLPLKRCQYFFIGYIFFILLKALLGYFKWGVLALRHSAMFYYPIFIFFGYTFFRKEFLPQYLRFFLVIFIIITLNKFNYVSHWGSSLFLLGIVLAVSIGSRILRYLTLLLIFIFTPYVSFLSTARMIIIGNLMAIVFFMLSFLFMSQISFKNKTIICWVVIGISIICYILCPDKARLHSIFNIRAIYTGFKENMKLVRERIGDDIVHVENKDVHIFNPTEEKIRLLVVNKQPLFITKLWDNFCFFVYDNLNIKKKKRHLKKKEQRDKGGVKRINREWRDATISVAANKLVALEGKESDSLTGKRLSINEVSVISEPVLHSNVKHVVGHSVERESASAVDVSVKKHSFYNQQKENNVRLQEKETIKTKKFYPMVKKKKEHESVKIRRTEELKKHLDKSYVASEKEKKIEKLQEQKIGNILFRLFIWHDVFMDMRHMGMKVLLGADFGRPFISPSLKALHWGEGEWSRDGWIAIHNSYLNMIYRAGIVGVGFILFVIISFFKMVKRFIMIHSYIGILLCTIFVVWFVAANFLLIFEMPYTAIPIWSLYGATLAYCNLKCGKQ